jgi:hypothetical protein
MVVPIIIIGCFVKKWNFNLKNSWSELVNIGRSMYFPFQLEFLGETIEEELTQGAAKEAFCILWKSREKIIYLFLLVNFVRLPILLGGYDTQHNDIQHKHKWNAILKIMTFSIAIHETQHSAQIVAMLIVIYVECHLCWVSFMLSVIYAECHLCWVFIYAECLFMLSVFYADSHLCWVSFMMCVFYAECPLCWLSSILIAIYADCHLCWLSSMLIAIYDDCHLCWL